MTKSLKRFVAMFLSIMMVVGMMPTMVFAEDTVETQSESSSVVYVAQIGDQKFETFAEAFEAAQNDDEVKILTAGTYSLTGISGKNITVTSKVNDVVFTDIGAFNMGGADVTFNNVTFTYAENSTYKGLQHSGDLVYNNCTINGQVFLYGESETFNNCVFNTTDSDNYNVWTYGAQAVEFNGCTFNSAGKSVLVYTESAAAFTDLTVTDTDFNASSAVDGKAAIEIDTSLSAGANITVDAATTATGFGTGSVSGNSLWNNKKGNDVDAAEKSNDITIVVGDETVLEPIVPVAKVGNTIYASLQDALDAAKDNAEIAVDLVDDATLDITAWQTLAIGGENTMSITINGNGKTLTFNKLNSDWNNIATNNDAKLILNNMTITDSGYNNGPWNRYDLNFACDVELNNVTATKALAFKADAVLNTVTINESGDSYAIWIQPNGQTVEIDGLTVNSEGRGIKIDEQYVDAPGKVTLSVEDAAFTTVKKAAILVKSVAGADISLTNVDISGVAADSVNAVWSDEDNVASKNLITVTGGTMFQEGTVYVAQVGETKYEDLQEAIVAAAPAGTVEILSDVAVDEWVMIAESLSIGNDNLITCVLDGLTINGNNHTLTINSIESAGNGGYLFFDATKLNINNLTIKYADGLAGAIGLKAGTLNNVTFDGCVYGVIPQSGDVVIQNCTFKTTGTSIYFEEERDGLTVIGCTFENADSVNVILLRGDVEFTNNTVVSGRTVNVVSGSPVVTGNNFNNVRFKVYNDAEAKIENNTINVLAFNDGSEVKSTFADNNILSEDAQAVLEAAMAPAGPVEVTTYEELIEALAENNANVIMMNDITATATQSSGYGKAGIVLEAGDTLDGNNYTLIINGANSTWDCAIAMRGGEVKNLTIAGAMRGVFMPGANGDVVIDNCVFKDVIYTFNSDAGSKDYSVTIKNTTLNGWTSFSNVHKSVTFTDCEFGEGSGYAYCRPYQATNFTGCAFEESFEFDTAAVAENSCSFTDCTYNGAALSAENNAMFIYGGKVIIDNVSTDVTNYSPTGSNSFAYTKEVDGYIRVWGEGGGNAKESFVLKLYAEDTLIATTQLNNIGGIINGNVYVTWNFFYPESNDEYWTTTWEEGHPNADAQPTKVELYIDGTLVATTDAQMNGADGLSPVVWAELGGVAPAALFTVTLGAFYTETVTTLEEALNVFDLWAPNMSLLGYPVITLNTDYEFDAPVVVDDDYPITIDLNGHTMTYNSTTQGEAMITNKGTLTINDSVGTGVINYNYTGAADSTYGNGNYTISNAGTLTVNGGKITIADLRAHAKYPIDNNSTTGDAILVINGGHLYNYNTSAIRQYCNSTTNKNSVTINGGLIEGYCAIWVQNPGKNTVNGSLSIAGGEIKTTASAYVNGTSALKDVTSRIYCTIDGKGGAWSTDSSVSITGGTINENVNLAEDAPESITVDTTNATFNGKVELPAPAAVLSGSGTATDPYIISNLNELKAFRDYVNEGNTYADKYIKLTADIDLSDEIWTPIGTSNYDKTPTDANVKMFAGNFDGGNHIITGLTSKGYVPDSAETGSTEYSFGLFGYVYGANISNVKLTDVAIDCGTRTDSAGNEVYGSGIAALIGYYVPANEKTTVISNCHVLSGTVEASNNMGGLIGHMDSQLSQPAVDITIENCSNAADVTTEAREAGGILGLMNSAREGNYLVTMRGTVIFKNCVNTGDITSLGGGAPSAGGILGRDHNQAAGQRLKIVFDSCKNSGTITITANGETHAAGIGAGYYSNGAWLISKDCENTGNVVVNNPNSEVYAGGLISYGGVVELINSTSTGTVTGGIGNTYVGGAQNILFLEKMDNFTDTVNGYTYYLNGGTSPEYAALVDDAAGGGNFHLVETAYKDGAEFGGWYDNAALTGEAYTALNKNVKTYYAKWIGDEPEYVAQIVDGDSYTSLQDAIDKANGATVILLRDVKLANALTVPTEATVVLDLNGKTISGTDNATSNFGLINIQPGAELTINDTSAEMTGKITLTATNDRDWNAYSSVISNQRGKLIVNGGTIEHLGGTDMAYGIDNLTNTGAQIAETVINGGMIKSTYRAIRQFLNSSAEGVNNILTVNGGTIEGANKSIWMQQANASANPGTLTVKAEAALYGDVLLSAEAAATEYPVTLSLAAEALRNGATVVTGSAGLPAGYVVENTNGTWGVSEATESPFGKLAAIVNMPIVEQDGGKFHPVQILNSVESLNYRKVGFYIRGERVGGEPVEIKKETNTVYDSYIVNKYDGTQVTLTPAQLSGNYLYGVQIWFTVGDWTNDNTTLYVTPFAVDMNGKEILGETKVFNKEILAAHGTQLFKEEN